MTELRPEEGSSEDDNGYLSYLTLSDDDSEIFLNGNEDFSVKIPLSLKAKRDQSTKRGIIQSLIYEGCTIHKIDYIDVSNVFKLADEVLSIIYERARVNKKFYVVPPTSTEIVENYKNDYFEYLVGCAKRTVKEEDALVRQIMYTLLSAYSSDPNNLADVAPAAAGKTYPIMECVKYTPGGKEVRIVASMTPKVLIREQGVLVDKKSKPIGKEVRKLKRELASAKMDLKSKDGGKSGNRDKAIKQVEQLEEELTVLLEDSAYVIDLTNKTLIFLEPPRPELWELLKPILSHDYFEMEHPFVDNLGHGLEVKRIITRGWPAFIVCTAKDESKWEVWPEIESRCMVVSPNMIKPKYLAGNKLIAQKKGLPQVAKERLIISEAQKKLGAQCFLYLKHQIQQQTSLTNSPVFIPYLQTLADAFPADKGQDNRAFNRFASMITIIALCKAHIKHRLIYGNEELVIATLEDLRETLYVMQNVTGLPPHKLKFYREYILPLYKNKGGASLETRAICDFYNADNPKSNKMNADNLRKNYLQELVNHNYLEQEQDGNTKATRYLYTPLVDATVDNGEEVNHNKNNDNSQEKQPATSQTLESVFQKLHFSPLLAPEHYQGIPKEWLKQQFLQLLECLLTSEPMRILDKDGNEIPLDIYVKAYESSYFTDDAGRPISKMKLQDFVRVPRSVCDPKSTNFTITEPQCKSSGVEITINHSQEEEKWKTRSKIDRIGNNNKKKKQEDDDVEASSSSGNRKCPYCDYVAEKPALLEHHITYTDRPGHGPKNRNYRNDQHQQQGKE